MKIDNNTRKKIHRFVLEKISQEKTKTVEIDSPYSLTKEEKQMLLNKIPEFKNRQIVNHIDKTLIGGVIIRFGSRVYDLSIKNRLDNISDSLLNQNL